MSTPYARLISNQYQVKYALSPFTRQERNSSKLCTTHLRISFLDSPSASDDDDPVVAAICVPYGHETNWLFDTENGLKRLMETYYNVSRLFLIGNDSRVLQPKPITRYRYLTNVEEILHSLGALLKPYHPLPFPRHFDTKFICYKSDVMLSSLKELVTKYVGPSGAFSVYDEQLTTSFEIRRRLRFKSCPDFIQSEVRMIPKVETSLKDYADLTERNIKLEVDWGVLVDDFSSCVVGGLNLVSKHLNTVGKPRVLCLGLGGGFLATFLSHKFKFDVVGVEWDEKVLQCVKNLFEFDEKFVGEEIISDALCVISEFAQPGAVGGAKFEKLHKRGVSAKFQVLVLDINSPDNKAAFGVCSPPRDFIEKTCLENMSSCLDDKGILVVNVLTSDYVHLSVLVENLKICFPKLYRSKSTDEKAFVIFALKCVDDLSGESEYQEKLKALIPDFAIEDFDYI